MSFGGDIYFRVEEPSNGRRFCFDLIVKQEGRERRFSNVKSDFRWYHRLWHRVMGWFRRG